MQPIPHNELESLIAAEYPVYWLGRAFHGLPLSEATRDPSGGFSVLYGACKQGGQGTCLPPLRVVTSPDNSFVPGGTVAGETVTIRGVSALVTRDRHTIVLPTGSVIVAIYALDSRLAAAAAQTAVPINAVGSPAAPLAPPAPDTHFAASPLPQQIPSQLAPLPSLRAHAPRARHAG
jgi:hypothetical protein